MQFEECTSRLNASDFPNRSKAKAKPQRREPADSSTRTVLIGVRSWTVVEPSEYSLLFSDISKKLIHLLRHGKQIHREDDGATEFWRIEDNLQKHFLCCVLIGRRLCTPPKVAWTLTRPTPSQKKRGHWMSVPDLSLHFQRHFLR